MAFPFTEQGQHSLFADFGALYRAYTPLCQRLAQILTDKQPMTRGPGGSLTLSRTFTVYLATASLGALSVPIRLFWLHRRCSRACTPQELRSELWHVHISEK